MVSIVSDSLPHSEEAERSLLGSILLDNDQFENVQELISSRAFYSPRNRRIYRALEELSRDGSAFDLVTLKDQGRSALG